MTSHSAMEAYAEASPDGEGHRFTRIDLLGIFYVKFLKNTTKGIRTEIKRERPVRLQSAEANSVIHVLTKGTWRHLCVCLPVDHKLESIAMREYSLTYYIISCTGGDSKTLMVVQVAPVEKNVAETVCSLNFAQRVRTVELGQATKRTIKSWGMEY